MSASARSKLILINGVWRINPHFLLALPTIRRKDPWELKLQEEYKGVTRRWWVGGYFDAGEWVEPAVTVDRKYQDKWIEVEQYDLRPQKKMP